MKLKNLPNKESFENYTFRLRESQAHALREYHAYINQIHGAELTLPELLTSIVTSFVEDDKEFQKARQKSARASRTIGGGHE